LDYDTLAPSGEHPSKRNPRRDESAEENWKRGTIHAMKLFGGDWSRGDTVATLTLLVASIGTIAAVVVVPEFRAAVGLGPAPDASSSTADKSAKFDHPADVKPAKPITSASSSTNARPTSPDIVLPPRTLSDPPNTEMSPVLDDPAKLTVRGNPDSPTASASLRAEPRENQPTNVDPTALPMARVLTPSTVAIGDDPRKDKFIRHDTGTVKWFNAAKGYGFISGRSGPDVFVHFSGIVEAGFRSLEEGSDVEFDVVQTSKGFAAQNVKLHRLHSAQEDAPINKK
jgi:CspA family cold shock protein